MAALRIAGAEICVLRCNAAVAIGYESVTRFRLSRLWILVVKRLAINNQPLVPAIGIDTIAIGQDLLGREGPPLEHGRNARNAECPRRFFYIKGPDEPLKGMYFHIAHRTSGNILCCGAFMAPAFRRGEDQPRGAKHCLPTALAVGQRRTVGREEFEETTG